MTRIHSNNNSTSESIHQLVPHTKHTSNDAQLSHNADRIVARFVVLTTNPLL